MARGDHLPYLGSWAYGQRMTRSARSGRRAGFVSSAALALSGFGIAAQPNQALAALGMTATSRRGVTETRVGLGGTYAALGLWAMVRRSPEAYRAVGMTWLGAGVVRLVSMRIDDPDTDWTFWAYLGGELGLGAAGLGG
jgi:hypothetical protein